MTCPATANDTFYLGPAGNLKALPDPDPYESTPSFGDVSAGLLLGGYAVVRHPLVKRTVPLAWGLLDGELDQADVDTIMGLYLRAYGPGPYCLIDPTWRNVLTFDASTTGGLAAGSTPWVTSDTSTIAPDSTLSGPEEQAGVLRWTGLAATSVATQGVLNGAGFGDADPTESVPLVKDVPVTFSIDVATTGTASLLLRVANRNGDGTDQGHTDSAAVALTAGYQRLAVTITPDGSAKYAALQLAMTAWTSGDVLVSAAQAEYDTAASAFTAGVGSPRVLMKAAPAWRVPLMPNKSAAFTLVEV